MNGITPNQPNMVIVNIGYIWYILQLNTVVIEYSICIHTVLEDKIS